MRAGHRRRKREVEDQLAWFGEDATRRDILVWNGNVARVRDRATAGVPCADAPSQIFRREAEAAEPLGSRAPPKPGAGRTAGGT